MMNQLIIWKDVTLFLGKNPRAISNHQHPMIQLIIGVREAFVWKNPAGNWEEKRTLLVAPNQQHECDAKGKEIITLGIDPESLLGTWILKEHLSKHSLIEFPIKLDIKVFISQLLNQHWEVAYQAIEELFNFSSSFTKKQKKDQRIQKILAFITSNIHSHINTQMLMEIVHLSESRILHLFKEEMGLPIRNYILWYRLQIALKSVIDGQSLTEAAYIAGFSDQAHLTRTCVKCMGIPPSIILKNSKIIQVSFPQ